MFHIIVQNKHGDMYHEKFATLDAFFGWLEATIGQQNVKSLRVKFVPEIKDANSNS